MKQVKAVASQLNTAETIVYLTRAFESLASMRISQIKTRVERAQTFFDELWQIYSQIRIDTLFGFGRSHQDVISDRQLFILITASGGFSGDIDQRLVTEFRKSYDPAKHDVIVIGHHGRTLLKQNGVNEKHYFKLPDRDDIINVEPLVREVRQYKSTTIYYQAYESLMSQSVKKIEMSSVVQAMSRQAALQRPNEIISEATYIFEPSSIDVIAHLERSMLQIALTQLIFESKLAQYASRFRAMTVANERAETMRGELRQVYSRTRRARHDEQLKEMMAGLKKKRLNTV